MCLYIAASQPLPLIPLDKRRPALYVAELGKDDDVVRHQFTKPHVYYLGAHTKCSCGFNYYKYNPEASRNEQRNRETCKRSREALASYLRQALAIVPEIELFACWNGEEAEQPEHRAVVTPDYITQERTHFLEREFLTVQNQPASPP
jgi:hypothetical protein